MADKGEKEPSLLLSHHRVGSFASPAIGSAVGCCPGEVRTPGECWGQFSPEGQGMLSPCYSIQQGAGLAIPGPEKGRVGSAHYGSNDPLC